MYVTDQPSFWNGADQLTTDLEPHALLERLKWIEQDMGRNVTAATESDNRNGPRPLDLDILLCYKAGDNSHASQSAVILNTDNLTVPHPRIHEREFVLRPLVDMVGGSLVLDSINSTNKSATIGELLNDVVAAYTSQDAAAERIIPLPCGRHLVFGSSTLIRGILNVTPDSFSDGGQWTSAVSDAVDRAMEMIAEGASIVDIGGESTRPGAREISVEEQIQRTVPVIEGIRSRIKGAHEDVAISIDTRHAAVARAAVKAGADIVNDVSGGTFDDEMLATVPMVLMHMRGTPETMQGLTNYSDDGGVVDSVANALLQRSRAAEEAGIPRWMQILDPGIGFAKGLDSNLSLLRHYSDIRTRLGDIPLLLGTSRKGFIGKINGETVATNRDFGTVGSCVAALCLGSKQHSSTSSGRPSLGCNILRVHNVKGTKQAIEIMDAIVNAP
ncbi:MAG: hypothetical protein SGARI_004373 [Bacillariaceae sp.]